MNITFDPIERLNQLVANLQAYANMNHSDPLSALNNQYQTFRNNDWFAYIMVGATTLLIGMLTLCGLRRRQPHTESVTPLPPVIASAPEISTFDKGVLYSHPGSAFSSTFSSRNVTPAPGSRTSTPALSTPADGNSPETSPTLIRRPPPISLPRISSQVSSS